MSSFDLHVALHHARHYLPAQNPLERFVHHNTLHAFESHQFDDALALAGDLYGSHSYMPEHEFRACLRSGRITLGDIAHVLEHRVPDEPVVPGVSRRWLAELALRYGPDAVDDAAVEFELSEGGALRRLRSDLTPDTRTRLLAGRPEEAQVRALYDAARTAFHAARASLRLGHDEQTRESRRRLRSAAEELRRAKLIRWCAAFLDCGVADWTQPDRSRGFFEGFRTAAGVPSDSAHDLLSAAGRVAAEAPTETAEECVLRCLGCLAVPEDERAQYVRATLLELPGWAGMFARVEDRPDQLPTTEAPPARVLDFLAVSLLLKVASQRMEPATPAAPAPRASGPSEVVSVYRLFRLAQLLGLDAERLAALSVDHVVALWWAWEGITETTRLRWFQAAYERHYHEQVLHEVEDHLAAQALVAASLPRAETPTRAVAQVICCIDDREESLRRHIEAIASDVETYAAAGFFGVAMAYQGLGQRETFPLCPPVVTPRHKVREGLAEGARGSRSLASVRVPAMGRAKPSHTLVRGALVALAGAVALAPMSAGVLAPRLRARFAADRGHKGTTRLALLRTDDKLEDGLLVGFSYEEMADIVRGLLAPMGILPKLAPLVLLLGHGSHSENNPQAAAYNCGACAGGHGGPNARAFAQMANAPEVRALLASRHGVTLPEDTWFVGGMHDTADEEIVLADLDLLPESHRDRLKRLVAVLDEARIRDAEERCRTFATGVGKKGVAALRHVQARAEDLAQPRPELGHARNAACVVGRRAWTRGLDLDRRAFLVCYDPTTDPGDLLLKLLSAVVPVCAGISLEYYFSYVDPQRYGAGTKLPHNLTGLLGVMDGHASDLRTGLPWQMVEVHEPMRLLFLVETTPATLLATMDSNPAIAQLVENEWVHVAVIHPTERTIHQYRDGRFELRTPKARMAVAS